MTLAWGFEMISTYHKFSVYIVSDIINCLQGLVIFIIFVLHKTTCDLIMKKFRGESNIPKPEENDDDDDDDKPTQNEMFQKL